MKRNKQSTRAMRQRGTVNSIGTQSKFAQKVALGKQMYGPGCCGHPTSKKA